MPLVFRELPPQEGPGGAGPPPMLEGKETSMSQDGKVTLLQMEGKKWLGATGPDSLTSAPTLNLCT